MIGVSEAFPVPAAAGREVEWGRGRFRFSELPEFSGVLSATLHGGVPYFEERDFEERDFEDAGHWDIKPVDALGRARCASVVVGSATVQAGERPSRHLPDPSGWHPTSYPALAPPELYDRSHLAAWVLTGAYDEPGNLFTATTSLNRSGMKPYENRVLRYVRQRAAAGADSRVLYRVRPRFVGDELVARGVLVEAASFADRGASLLACAWCYNVRPGVEIEYMTGYSRLAGVPAGGAGAAPGAETSGLAAGGVGVGGDAVGGAEVVFAVVPGTAEFHAPGCGFARAGSGGGTVRTSASREALIVAGYQPCEACRP